MSTDSVKSAYPRPDFVRSGLTWRSLNGSWDFLFDDEDIGLSESWYRKEDLPLEAVVAESGESNRIRTIQVPFVFQAPASGIGERGVHEVLWYQRYIQDIRTEEQRKLGHRLVLRFGAVDYYARVWVDGVFVGEHRGGHVPFEFDITDALPELLSQRCRVIVRVFDSASDLTQPRGKQFWEPEPRSIYYTPSSGIWQSVWLESVPYARICDSSHGTLLRSNDIDSGQLHITVAVTGRRARQKYAVQVEARIGGVHVSATDVRGLPEDQDFTMFDHDMRLSLDQRQDLSHDLVQQAPLNDSACWQNGIALWSPEHPLLYDLTIRLLDASKRVVDEINTTVGMRSLSWTAGDGTFRLNGHPYFHALLLDQGYWPDSLMTAPNDEALKQDIELSKKMGFNGCRKHQKVEDPGFMYWANKLGFLVWGEMASCFEFSTDMRDRFDQEWIEMVRRDMNHPCVVAWTPLNESWGYPNLEGNINQRDHVRSLYFRTRTLDPTRPINDNCGWEHVVTDLSTFHDYGNAAGMRARCRDINSILNGGTRMFLSPLYRPNGRYDEGSRHVQGAPILCTEFGGVNIASSFHDDRGRKANWGYTTARDSSDLLKRVEDIMTATVQEGHVCGFVWTQL